MLYIWQHCKVVQILMVTSVSTDTSLQDHFVIRPSSKILDYTVLSENKSDTQIEVIIRAAVGNLPPKKCQSSRPLTSHYTDQTPQ